MDWFSNLPDELLTNILSFLSLKQGVQTCILSKQWTHAWSSLPVLKFNVNDWLDFSVYDEQTLNEGQEHFEVFLYGVLANREPTAKLDSIEYNNYIDCISSEQISLEFFDQLVPLEPRFICVDIGRCQLHRLNFPNSIFSCKSIENLQSTVYTENLALYEINQEEIHLPALRTLNLMGIALRDSFIPSVCSQHSVIETLVLKLCDLEISEISSQVLKTLTLYKCSQSVPIKISCPLLRSIAIESYEESAGFEICNCESLEYAKICIDLDKNPGDTNLLNSISNVKYLTLCLWGPHFKEKLEHDISECGTFTNLQNLDITYWGLSHDIEFIVHFLQNSPSLEVITLQPRQLLDSDAKEELISQEGLINRRNVLFQREYLKTVRIVKRKRQPDMVVARLINNLHTLIKTIEQIFII